MDVNTARLLTAIVCGALSGVAGCATQVGLLVARNLPGEYHAPAISPVKVGGLAKLGRPADQEHRIQPGERLEVSCSNLVEEIKTETFSVRVEDDGTVSVPLLSKRLPVGLLTSAEAEQVVRSAYAGANLIRNPQVT